MRTRKNDQETGSTALSEAEIRLRCVEAAVAAQRSPNADADAIVSTAQTFYTFVKSKER